MLVSEAMLGPAAAPAAEPVLRQSYGNASKVQTISVVAGDLIFVAFSAGGSLISASISDTVNTYSEITGAGFACTPSSIHAHCWSAVATTTGSLTLTITSAASYPVIIVHVYSGCDGTLDGASYKAEASASTSHTTNSLTTTAAQGGKPWRAVQSVYGAVATCGRRGHRRQHGAVGSVQDQHY